MENVKYAPLSAWERAMIALLTASIKRWKSLSSEGTAFELGLAVELLTSALDRGAVESHALFHEASRRILTLPSSPPLRALVHIKSGMPYKVDLQPSMWWEHFINGDTLADAFDPSGMPEDDGFYRWEGFYHWGKWRGTWAPVEARFVDWD